MSDIIRRIFKAEDVFKENPSAENKTALVDLVVCAAERRIITESKVIQILKLTGNQDD